MRRSKGITLKGAAAMAFVNGGASKDIRTGKKLTVKDKALAIAAKIQVLMSEGKEGPADLAAAILVQLESQGIDAIYETHVR